MTDAQFRELILKTLEGETPELSQIPPARRDWSGTAALYELFDRTAGEDREAMIRAMGQLIRQHPAPESVIAELVDIATSLDLAQVEPDVRALQENGVAATEPLRGTVSNYLALRKLSRTPLAQKVDRMPAARSPMTPDRRRRRN